MRGALGLLRKTTGKKYAHKNPFACVCDRRQNVKGSPLKINLIFDLILF